MNITEKILNTLFKNQINKIKNELKNEIELKSYAVSQSSNASIEEALKRAFSEQTEPELLINYMVFVCLTFTTEETGKIKLKVFDKNNEENTTNPFALKLEYLNPLYSYQGEFIEHIVLSLIYYGVAYILNMQNYLYVIKKTDLEDVVLDKDTGLPVSYKYKGKSYTDKDIIVIKNINNPNDPTSPYSIFDSIEKIAKLTDKGVVFLRNFFEEGGFIPGFFKSTNTVDGIASYTANNYDELKEEKLFKKVMKKIKSGKAGILPPNYEYIPAGTSPKDSTTIDIMKHIEDIIATSFRVPKSIIGKLTSGGSYSLTNAERKIFYDCVIDVFITKIEGAFNQYIKRFVSQDLIVKRDISSLAYLKLYMLDYATQIAQIVGSGILTKNEARERFFDLPAKEGGDDLGNTNTNANNNLTNSDDAGDRGNPVQDGDEKKNKKSIAKSEESQQEIDDLTKIYQDKISKILDPLIRDLIIDLKDIYNLLIQTIYVKDENKDKKPSDYEDEAMLILLFLNSELLQNVILKFEKVLKKYYLTAIKRADRILAEINNEEREENPQADYEDWANTQVKNSSKLFYENDIIAIILGVILMNKDENLEKIAELIKSKIEDMINYKPKIWATTEMMKTINEYFYKKAESQTNVKKVMKTWRSMRDEKVRIAHQIADNNIWIPFNQKFVLTTSTGATYTAMRPYDPELPPELVINCRCFLLVKYLDKN